MSSLSPPFDSQFKVVIDKSTEEAEYKEEEEDEEDEEEQDVKSKTESCYDFNKDKRPQTCTSCQSKCTNEQYCSTTLPDFYLCKKCFMEGKYPSKQESGRFVVERFDDEVADAWDDEEEELLREGLGIFGDNWEKVSNHVGSRSHDECILHYLQLPMNDPFHDVEVEKLGLLQYDSTQHRENPIMTAVAFLAASVEPKVAAAAGNIEAFEIIPIKQAVKDEETEEEEVEKIEDETKPVRSELEEADLCELTNTLIQHKLTQYKQQASNYQGLENIVEEQKIQLEKEKRQLEQDQGALKRKVLSIRQEMAKRISKANAIASIITPAQLQQQLAGGNPAMFLNGNQRHHHQQQHQQLQQQHQQLQQHQQQRQQQHQQHQSPQALQQLQLQQQQYQLQMQMQMQQQARPNGPGYNNMMSL